MNGLEKQFLVEATEGADPELVVRSQTKIDTGRWWRKTPMWLCIVAEELLMMAVSRRRYVARLALEDVSEETYYCHATGELVIEPGEELMYSRFRVSPKQALSLLRAMEIPESRDVASSDPASQGATPGQGSA